MELPSLTQIPRSQTELPILGMSHLGAGIAAPTIAILGAIMQGSVFKEKIEWLFAAFALCVWCLIGIVMIVAYGFVPPLIRVPDNAVGLLFAFLSWTWLCLGFHGHFDPTRLNPNAFKRKSKQTQTIGPTTKVIGFT